MKELTPEEAAEKLARRSPKGKPVEPIPAIPYPSPEHDTPLMKQAREGISVGQPGQEWKDVTIPVNGTLAGRFEMWPTADVMPREDNPRLINEKSKSFVELVASVQSAGVITPGIARPHPQMPGKLELLAGHRRHRAAGVTGLAEFPVVVREMDDRTALEVLVFENLDRENLTPLEEARGVDLLLKSKHEPAEIASRMGKTVSWVARRVQLLQLTRQWKEWAEEWNVSAAHLELIARLDRGLQEEIFDQLTEDEYQTQEVFFQPGSLAKLRARLQEEMRELKQAPWALDNAVLSPKAGACAACPKRSGCQPDLFSDPEDAGDRCLDQECWKGKMATFKKQREADLRKEHPNLVLIPGKGNVDWREADAARKRGALESWNFTECKKSSDGAVPALIVYGKGEGLLTWVTLKQSGGRGTREGAAKPAKATAADKQAAASLDPAESAKLLAEKQEAHEKRRWAWVAERLREILKEMVLPVAEEFRTAEGLCRLVAAFETDTQGTIWVADRRKTWAALADGFGQETKERVWQLVKGRIDATLVVYKVSDIGPETHASIQGACMLLGLDIANLKEQADREIPEPKSWEQLRKLSEAPVKAEKPKKVVKGKGGKAA